MNLSTNLEESDTVESFILSLELVISIDIPLKEKKKRRYEQVLKKAMFCVGEHPLRLPERAEPNIKENKECLYYCMLIIMVFLCVPNQDRTGAVILYCFALHEIIFSKTK